MAGQRTIPLFPLPDVVHFPRTDLYLHVFEPRYRALVRDLGEQAHGEPLIGIVLIRSHGGGIEASPPIYQRGTAGLLADVEHLRDGASNIRLEGQFRFDITRELSAQPYRRAIVDPLPDSRLTESTAEVSGWREDLFELLHFLQATTRRMPAFGGAKIDRLPTEDLVNGLAAHLDLPALAKLDLLNRDLPERTHRILAILRSRRRVVELLQPFRDLSTHPDLN